MKEKKVSTLQKVSIVMPYLGNMSNFMKRRIKNLVEKNLVNCDLSIIFSSPKRLRDILKFKDQIPLNLRSFVIYNFKCSSCNATYIGKTFRHFKQRAGEHLCISHLTNKKSKTHWQLQFLSIYIKRNIWPVGMISKLLVLNTQEMILI